MKLKMLHLINNEDSKAYKKALLTIGNNHPYYQIEFLDVFYSGLDLAKAFVYIDRNNIPLIVMPFYLRPIENVILNEASYFDVISTWGYNGPLYNSELSSDILKSFWEQVDVWYTNNNIVSEFIRFNSDGNHINYSGELVIIMNIIKGKLINLETIWSNYNRKVRKNINKAKREELYTKIYYGNDITPDIIDQFYDIYIHTMERTNAKDQYYNSKEKLTVFMRNCPDNCAIALTFKNEIAIASEIILISNDSLFSFIGGTLFDYFNMRPNEILKHDVIAWGIKGGFKFYVLGGGLGQEDGIFNYKKTFFPNDLYHFVVGQKILNQSIYNELCKMHNFKICDDNTSFFPLYRKN